MRIIAGKYRSRTVKSVPGTETRPTSDKIKGAVFSSLQQNLENGAMLDCYSGTGNMALEALSRGMSYATMVDMNRQAIMTIKENVKSLQVKNCEVLQGSIFSILPKLKYTYRFVYVDPPYAKQENERLLHMLDQYGLVEEEGHVVIESTKEDTFADEVGCFKKVREKLYGITKITYYVRRMVE